MPSAAILAGGDATRFAGRDKSALVVGGRSILARQIEELSRIADDILLVGLVGPSRPSHEPVQGTPVRCVPDRVSRSGPLGGLDAALAAARHDTLILVACDMPFVTAAFLRHLLSLTTEADAVVPRTEDGYHPLCAAYTRACHPAVMRRLAQGQLAMTGLLSDVRLRVVGCEEIDAFGNRAHLLANVNTLAAYQEVARRIDALQGHQR